MQLFERFFLYFILLSSSYRRSLSFKFVAFTFIAFIFLTSWFRFVIYTFFCFFYVSSINFLINWIKGIEISTITKIIIKKLTRKTYHKKWRQNFPDRIETQNKTSHQEIQLAIKPFTIRKTKTSLIFLCLKSKTQTRDRLTPTLKIHSPHNMERQRNPFLSFQKSSLLLH